MKNELLEALNVLEQEKNISKETLIEAIENSLITACKNHFGKAENVKVEMDKETCEYHVYQEKTVVEEVEDPVLEISLAKAKMIDSKYEVGDIVNIEVKRDLLQGKGWRPASCRDQVQGIRSYCDPECKERDPAEDP